MPISSHSETYNGQISKRQTKILWAEHREYLRLRRYHLAANPFCALCLLLTGQKRKAKWIHHKKGRKRFYLDESTFVTVHHGCDRWIHIHPEEAAKLGLLDLTYFQE